MPALVDLKPGKVTEPEELVFSFPTSVLFPSTIMVTFTFDDFGSASTLGATVAPTRAKTTGAPETEALDLLIVDVAFVGDEVDEFTDNALETNVIEGVGVGEALGLGEGVGVGEALGLGEGVGVGVGVGVGEALALGAGDGVGVGVGSASTTTGCGDVLGTNVEPDVSTSCGSCCCGWF